MLNHIIEDIKAQFIPGAMNEIYPHRLFKEYGYSESVRAALHERSSSWVIDRIFALQQDESGINHIHEQYWTLKNLPLGRVLLMCSQSRGGEVIYYEDIIPIKRPVFDCEMALKNNVLTMMP